MRPTPGCDEMYEHLLKIFKQTGYIMKKFNLYILMFTLFSLFFFQFSCSERAKRVAYPGAPPTIPHSILNERHNCLICHKNGTQDAPRTDHPGRVNCLQCHVPSNYAIEPETENVF